MKLPLVLTAVLTLAGSAYAQNAPVYRELPRERRSEQGYVRLPGWEGIRFIEKGEKLPALGFVNTPRLSEIGVNVDSLWEFGIHDLDIQTSNIRPQADVISISFAVDVKYREKDNPLAQGTLLTRGLIHLALNRGKIEGVLVEEYYDSQGSERIGRSLGIISKYNGEFASLAVNQSLSAYLSTTGLRALQRIVDERIKVASPFN